LHLPGDVSVIGLEDVGADLHAAGVALDRDATTRVVILRTRRDLPLVMVQPRARRAKLPDAQRMNARSSVPQTTQDGSCSGNARSG